MQSFPNTEKLHSVSVAEPIIKEKLPILSLQHVCKTNVVFIPESDYRHLRVFYLNFCHKHYI